MSLSDITDANAIRSAIAEFDGLGRDPFLQKYGFGRARQYFLRTDQGKLYDSKAIVGAAHGIQFPERGPMRAEDFSGGEQTVKSLLEQLGFSVTGPEPPAGSWDDSVSEGASPYTARVWVEKTLVRGRQDRQTGAHRVGEALVSPQKSADGRDIYANMRDVRPGDVVLHLTDNEAFTGTSRIATAPDATFEGVSGTEWSDRPSYRIQLQDFTPIDPPLMRDWLLTDETVAVRLRAIAEQPRGRGLFYNAKLEFNQGAYLTAIPDSLLEVLRQIYRQHTGKELLPAVAAKPASSLNESRLAAAVRLFNWVYGDSAFSSKRYLAEERNYKAAFSEKWRQAVTPEAMTAALVEDEATVTMATTLGRLLTDPSVSNVLPWRYAAVLKGTWAVDRARTFLTATRDLLFESSRDAPSVDEFQTSMSLFYSEFLNPDAVKPASHCIPSLMLWLSEPGRQFFLRPDLYNQAARSLLGGVAEGQGSIMSTTYYVHARDFAEILSAQLTSAGLHPADMIDVQGFLWGVFSRSRIWFGGHSYGQHKNVLPEFVARSVYATDWGRRPEIAEFFKNVEKLSADDRKTRRADLEKAVTEVGARKALTALFDLVGRAGALLLAKAVAYDHKASQSLIRLSGIAVTGATYSFDEVLGHELEANWLTQFSEKFVLPSRLFPHVNGTLASLPITDALDAFSTPYVPVPGLKDPDLGDEDVEKVIPPAPTHVIVDREPFTLSRALDGLFMRQEEFERLLRIWHQKRNLVLQGAPGVGKSFVARRLAYSLIGYEDPGRVQMIQFHQSYSYEDFVQGYRPNGKGEFVLRDGVFVEFCNRALEDGGETYVLIIDEINRGNLSKILGELMLLIEPDKRSAKWAVHLAYADSGAPKFHVPQNVFILGLMNTADRSLAVVDYALRRRFAFATLRPAFSEAKFREHLLGAGAPDELAQQIINRMSQLNGKIEADLANLGPGFCIGHSFFVPTDDGSALDEDWYRQIVESEIVPLLQEYWYDDQSEVQRWQQALLS